MLSLAKVTPQMGEHYFSKEDYYSKEEGPAASEFFGKSAKLLGLKSTFNQVSFEKLLQGVAPNGTSLREQKSKVFSKGVKDYEEIADGFSKKIDLLVSKELKTELVETFLKRKAGHHLDFKTSKDLESELLEALRGDEGLKSSSKVKGVISSFVQKISKKNDRAGIDLTFSAPKSASLAALVGGKEDVLAAHLESVKFALGYIEENYIGTRVGSKDSRSFLNTKNMIAAIFNHGTSRMQDPQLHTHCVVINSTMDHLGRWKALHNDLIYRDSVLLGTIYQKKFADLLQGFGYKILPDKNGTFELEGYTEEQLGFFSKRSVQLKKVLKDQGLETGARDKRKAVLIDRDLKKIMDPKNLKVQWKQQASALGITHPRASLENKKYRAINWSFAKDHISERQSVWSREKLLLHTLQANIKNGKIESILKNFEKKSEVIHLDLGGKKIGLTNLKSIEVEEKILGSLKNGRGSLSSVAGDFDFESHTRERNFTKGQADAFKLALSNEDFISGWVGVAGSGKSYALKDVCKVASDRGYKVTGLAPDGNTSRELKKSTGMKTQTIDRFLIAGKSDQEKHLWIIDEAGKVSSGKFLDLLEKSRDFGEVKILMVGDTRQVSAVEAGSPFSLLINQGMTCAELLEHRRQSNPELKSVVEMASKSGLVSRSVLALKDCSKELRTRKSRISNLASQYMSLSDKDRDKTLVLTDINKDRLDLNEVLRKRLKAEKKIGSKDFEIVSLKQRDLTQAQKKNYWSYKVGDVLVAFEKNEYGLEVGEQFEVTGIDRRSGKITTRGKIRGATFPPRVFSSVSIYSQKKMKVAEGDKLQFTKNTKLRSNREIVKVQKITDERIYFENSHLFIARDERQFLDHVLVQTTYSSQGQTAKNVLFLAESNISKETWYVGISRAKENVSVVTDNLERLSKRVLVSQRKENALDYSPIEKDLGVSL